MHSSRPDWVFGEARLISSTSRRLENTGPGRNSKRCSRWLYTLVPMTSAGSRSAVHCTRANCRSTERDRARASAVLPTPGASSTSTWPSATRATITLLSVSSSTSTARETFAASRRPRATAASHSSGATLDVLSRGSMTGLTAVAHAHHLVQYGVGDPRLRAAWDRALGPVGRDQGHLVVGRVEGDALGAHVVEDDEVEPLAPE